MVKWQIFCAYDFSEENFAARRLQWLYRKRQEEREKEECQLRNVFQPAVTQVYKGHRNSRTMVSMVVHVYDFINDLL